MNIKNTNFINNIPGQCGGVLSIVSNNNGDYTLMNISNTGFDSNIAYNGFGGAIYKKSLVDNLY